MMNEVASEERGNGNGHACYAVDAGGLELNLKVTDADLVGELSQRAAGQAREEYALAALHVGVLAFRHAGGLVDVEGVRAEGERLMAGLRAALSEHDSCQTPSGRESPDHRVLGILVEKRNRSLSLPLGAVAQSANSFEAFPYLFQEIFQPGDDPALGV